MIDNFSFGPFLAVTIKFDMKGNDSFKTIAM